MNPPRVAVVCDLLEENWPSMDLVSEMLLAHLKNDHADSVKAFCVRFRMAEPFGSLPALGRRPIARNADRLLGRFWNYPRALKGRRDAFDLFHIVDHSYSQLVHYTLPDRTIVTCHDLDTFKCLLDPDSEPRSKAFMLMAKRILKGFQKAAMVVCDSAAVKDQIVGHGLIPSEQIEVVPLGYHPSCSPREDSRFDNEAAALLGPTRADSLEILHVGSTVGRKRIDLLLRLFAALLQKFPQARLIRAGGDFTPEQRRLSEKLGLTQSIVVLPFLRREVLASVYRRAALVLQPSESEGFGLPVVEAMACGTPVVASDLKVLREVGGEAVTYCPVGDVEVWRNTITELLEERRLDTERWGARRGAALARASKFTWAEYARRMVDLYKRVLSAA